MITTEAIGTSGGLGKLKETTALLRNLLNWMIK